MSYSYILTVYDEGADGIQVFLAYAVGIKWLVTYDVYCLAWGPQMITKIAWVSSPSILCKKFAGLNDRIL